MKKAEKDRMYKKIELHGESLKRFFGLDKSISAIDLCKKLRMIEKKIHKKCEDFCNGIIEREEIEKESEKVMKQLSTVFGAGVRDIFVNHDARGYALKIRDNTGWKRECGIYSDWGGYGIIAPDLTNDIIFCSTEKEEGGEDSEKIAKH